jgi:5-methylcytosine-specific restriction endonuclease McrA
MTWPKRDYNDPHYKKFRTDVLKRDKFTCQMCGSKKKYDLQVHHLSKWADSPTLRYERSNGICLCKQCHKQITGYETAYAGYLYELVKRNERKAP